MKTATILALMPLAVCRAQLPERFTTIPGELSGYYWLSLSHDERVTFVCGFLAGYRHHVPDNTSAQKASRETCIAKLTNSTATQSTECMIKSLDAKSDEYKSWEMSDPTPNGTFGSIVEAADRFFAEPENRVMSITAAWIIAKWKQEGRPQAEIDDMMDRFRGTYIRSVRKSCEMGWGGWGITASRCEAVGTTLKPPPAK